MGKILNSFLSDKIEDDAQRLQRFNALLDAGGEACGEGFADALGTAMTHTRGQPYRKVDALFVCSTKTSPPSPRSTCGWAAWCRAQGLSWGRCYAGWQAQAASAKADLLSYLLFAGEYAADLVARGMRDADAMRQQLIDFFAV